MLNTQKTIIVIDDKTNPSGVNNVLCEKHNVFTASSEDELQSFLEKATPNLILIDFDIPDMDVYDVIKTLKSNINTIDIPIVLISKADGLESKAERPGMDVADYILKPFSKELLHKRVDTHLLLQQHAKDVKRYSGNLESLITEKAQTVSRLQNAVSKAAAQLAGRFGQTPSERGGEHGELVQSILLLLVRALISEDVYAEEFSTWERGVANMSTTADVCGKTSDDEDSLINLCPLSAQLNTIIKTVTSVVDVRDERFASDSKDKMMQYLQSFIGIMSSTDDFAKEICDWDIDMLLVSAQLHDIGKSAISGDILNKAESLTDAEFESIKGHVGIGVDMIRKISENIGDKEVLRYAEAIAATHHEKWDGTGYPSGLKGKEIPLQGRVMSLIDTYDALTSNRPHREKISHDKAVSIIKKLGGTHFDPQLVSLFAANENVFKRLNV